MKQTTYKPRTASEFRVHIQERTTPISALSLSLIEERPRKTPVIIVTAEFSECIPFEAGQGILPDAIRHIRQLSGSTQVALATTTGAQWTETRQLQFLTLASGIRYTVTNLRKAEKIINYLWPEHQDHPATRALQQGAAECAQKAKEVADNSRAAMQRTPTECQYKLFGSSGPSRNTPLKITVGFGQEAETYDQNGKLVVQPGS